MSPRQRHVLEVLAEHTDDGEWYAYLDAIAEQAGLERRETRVAVRALARMGYARLDRVFDEATGLVAGSGYAITRAGRRALEEGDDL